ncbi:MAG TPA: hypothetical protein VH596_12245 [Terriglobales bacterium]
MTAFSVVLFIHVLSAIALFIAITLEGFILDRLRSARDREQLQCSAQASRRLGMIYGPAFLGLLIGGIYLAWQLHTEAAWIPTALIATLIMAILGGAITGRKMTKLRKAVVGEPISFDSSLSSARSNSLLISYGFRAGLAVGIVFLMTTTPNLITSVVALSVTSILGIVVALASRGSSTRANAAGAYADSPPSPPRS